MSVGKKCLNLCNKAILVETFFVRCETCSEKFKCSSIIIPRSFICLDLLIRVELREKVRSSGMFLSFWWEPRKIEFDFDPFTIGWFGTNLLRWRQHNLCQTKVQVELEQMKLEWYHQHT